MSSCHKSLKGKEQKMQQQLHKEKKQENFLLSFMDYVSGYIKAIVKKNKQLTIGLGICS